MLNKDIVFTYEQINELRERADVRFPARISFSIMHNMKTLEPIVSSYYTARDEVVQKYGEPSDQPGSYVIPKENMQTVQDEFNSLDNTDVEVNLLKIKMSDLQYQSLSLKDMDALYCMIEE